MGYKPNPSVWQLGRYLRIDAGLKTEQGLRIEQGLGIEETSPCARGVFILDIANPSASTIGESFMLIDMNANQYCRRDQASKCR